MGLTYEMTQPDSIYAPMLAGLSVQERNNRWEEEEEEEEGEEEGDGYYL